MGGFRLSAADVDLSIVIVCYDMAREIPRTVESFLPPLQLGARDVSYEIVILDNGSPTPVDRKTIPRAENVDVRVIRIESAKSSPVFALNDCVARHVRSENVMICIDGARMASAGIVVRAIENMQRDPHSCVYVSSRHLGPDLQFRSCMEGYNQRTEDDLLAACDWQSDLDNLYGSSVWAGAVLDGRYSAINESNAITMSRETYAQIGGFDERFDIRGGGFCNLEFFSRAMARPAANNIILYGEATFHQYHGGASTAEGHGAYIRVAKENYQSVMGKSYERPEYNFIVDTGEQYDRKLKVGQYFAVDAFAAG